MVKIENNFSSLVSIIKIEPEEFQVREGCFKSISDDFLRRQAKIFSEPVVFLERVTSRKQQKTEISTLLEIKKERQFNGNALLDADVKKIELRTCRLCEKVFSSKCALKRHYMSVHNEGTAMFCDLCPKTFRVKVHMNQHMKSHMNKAFACNLCDYKTVHRQNFENHKRTHLKQEKCKICNKQVSSIKIHLRTHQKEPCTVCGKMISKDNLTNHMKTHDDNRCKCTDCSSTFLTREELRSHKLEQHYEGKIHRCYCGSVYKTKSNFNRHQRYHEEKTVACKVCERNFKNFGNLTRHYKVHHLQTHGPMLYEKIQKKQKPLNFSGPFICDKCGAILKTRKSFSRHFRIEHDIKARLFCDLCPKSFKYKYLLEDHMCSKHLEYNPNTCEVCGHKSTAKSSLKTHMLQHGPKKECKICHKMVKDSKKHMTTHVKVKCPTCGKTFPKKYIGSHMKKIHASKKS